MATAYIAEYAEPQPTAGSKTQVVSEPPLAEQTVAIGAEAKSAAFTGNTVIVRVHVDAVCSILFGTSPTATTSKKRMAANTTEYFRVQPADKISVITNT